MYVGIEEIRTAAIKLTPSAFKLYLYFVENEANWSFFLSPKDFYQAYGVAESTYRKAKQELVDKGYIIEGDKNHFDFYSTPQDNDITMEQLSKQLKDTIIIVRRYSEDKYLYFCKRSAEIRDLEEKEKKRLGKQMLQEMQDTIKELERDMGCNFIF